MTTRRLTGKTLGALEAQWPGFGTLWREIKAATGTRCRAPKSVWVSDAPQRPCPNDDSCAARFAVDLSENRVLDSVPLHCGEWVTANTNQHRTVSDIPSGLAIVTCEWNDYHRWFSMTVEVAPGTLRDERALPSAETLKEVEG